MKISLGVLVVLLQLAFPQIVRSHTSSSADMPRARFPALLLEKIAIVVSGSALNSLRQAPREDVPAEVAFHGRDPIHCLLHLKGSSTFQSIDNKPSFTIKSTRNGLLDGYSKIQLNNCVADDSLLRDTVGRAIFSSLGVPVGASGHAVVSLNGKRLGVYSWTEGINRRFLEKALTDSTGWLISGDNEDVTLPRATNVYNFSRNNIIDYYSAEILAAHEDGAVFNNNNYWLYTSKSNGETVVFPHTMDSTFRSISVIGVSAQCNIFQTWLHIPSFRVAALARIRRIVSDTDYWSHFLADFDRYSTNLLVNSVVFEPERVISRCQSVATLRRAIVLNTELLRQALLWSCESQEPGSNSSSLDNWFSLQPGAVIHDGSEHTRFMFPNTGQRLELAAATVVPKGRYSVKVSLPSRHSTISQATAFIKAAGRTSQIGVITQAETCFEFDIPATAATSPFDCRQVIVTIYLSGIRGEPLDTLPRVSIEKLAQSSP